MACDEVLVARIRAVLSRRDDVRERRMFGGVAFLVGGHMACGVATADLMLRVGPEAYQAALARPHARAMDFTGRPLTGYVYVAPAGLRTARALTAWLDRALAFVTGLPPRPATAKKRPPRVASRARPGRVGRR